MRRKTYNSQCTVCGQWYLTDVDPVKIVGAVTADSGLSAENVGRQKQPVNTNTTAQDSADDY